MTDTDLEQRLRDLKLAGKPPSSPGRPIDTAAAWREFQALRSRSVTVRRRALAVAAAAAVAGLVVAFPALTGAHSGPGNDNGNGTRPTTGTSIPATPRTYPRSVAGLIPMSGVTAVVGDAGHAWVVRAITDAGVATTYQFAGIDLRTNSIMFRTGVGSQSPSIAAGAGRLWLTTPYGQARGQVVRVDLATGKVLSTIHLRARGCSQLTFGSGHLFAACGDVRSSGADIWRINPRTQRAFRLAGPLRGFVGSLVAAPQALWYVVNYQDIRGLWNVNGVAQPVRAQAAGFRQTVPGQQSLVYSDGGIWALSGGERLARIDPFTGYVVRRFTYHNYDPRRAGGLDFLTAGGGWLWFLDNGYPFSGVLRVSESTGRPAGGVRIPPNSCGQQICSQIFYTPGSIWVPTAELLIRIDTSRLPG